MNADLVWAPWRKSSYSGTSGNCVEVAQATWRKSRHSGQTQNCIEVADDLPGVVGVRDSKNPDGPALVLTPGAWRAFVAGVKSGEFDRQ
jgi:hypothetical protein